MKLKKRITIHTETHTAVIIGILPVSVSFNHGNILQFGSVSVHGTGVTFAAVLGYPPKNRYTPRFGDQIDWVRFMRQSLGSAESISSRIARAAASGSGAAVIGRPMTR
jgi:hypothetical protein